MGGWNAWRSGPGRRPTQARDGRSTTAAQEGVLLRQVMALLDEEGAEGMGLGGPAMPPDDDFEAEMAGEGVDGARDEDGEEELIPDRADRDGAGSQAFEQSPNSVQEGEEAGPRGRPAPPASRADEPDDERSEAGSGSLGGGDSLAAQVKLYDPAVESLLIYNQRVQRVAKALVTMGIEVSDWELDVLYFQSSIIHEEAMSSAGALTRDKPKEAVRRLKAKWMEMAKDPTAEVNTVGMTAISELIEHYGGRISVSPGKAFSTPSTGPKEASERDGLGPTPERGRPEEASCAPWSSAES